MPQLNRAVSAPAPGRGMTWIGGLLVFPGVFAATFFVLMRLRGSPSDDSYIHFRNAEHLLHYGRPWFNVDDRVMSTSSPVWTLILAGFLRVLPAWNPVPFINSLAIATAALCSLILVTRSLPAENDGRGAWVRVAQSVTIFGCICVLIPAASEQMETPVAIALLGISLVWLDARPSLALTLLSLGGFVRYELFGFLLLAILHFAFRRRLKLQVLIGPACILAMFLTWLVIEFHAVIPNPIRAKHLAYTISARSLSYSVFSVYRHAGMAALALLIYLGVWLLLALARNPRDFYDKNAVGILLIVYGAASWVVYVASRTMFFDWYRPILLFPFCLGLVLCFVARQQGLRTVASLLFVGVVSLTGAIFAAAAIINKPSIAPGYGAPARVHTYLAVGMAINGVCPNARLMTSEIGGLGASFHGYI